MITLLLHEVKKFIRQWQKFWFAPKNDDYLKSLAIFRICFGTVIFFFYLSRTPDLLFFYSDEGILPKAYLHSLPIFQYNWSILFYLSNNNAIIGLHALFLGCLALVTIGLATPISTVITFLLHQTFLHRNMTVMFGTDMVGTFFFLYLCFASTNHYYSLDKYLGIFTKRSLPLTHVFYRLMQIQLCIVYWYAGLEKLKGVRWWDGSALWDVFSISDMTRFDLSFVAHVPFLLSIGAYSVILWEMFFPFLVWRPRIRLAYLLYGLMLHLGIILFLNLPGFGLMMLAIYTLFLTPKEATAILTAPMRWLKFTPSR
jgi:hypothetical protein